MSTLGLEGLTYQKVMKTSKKQGVVEISVS